MPDTPDDTPDDALDASAFDETSFDDLRSTLGDLAFLNPATAPDADPMPEAVWADLQSILGAEAASRAADEHANVVLLTPSNGPSRGMRWAGGLVAASVAVVAVGLAVGTMRGGSDNPATVAGGAASASSVRASTLSATPEAAPEAPAAGAAEDTAVSMAAAEPAARIVMASNTNYLPEELPGQVVSLVKNAGFNTAEEAMAKVVPPADMPVDTGFTASWEALRACLTWLTQSPDIQALVVDRATYAGNDAGVIVAPATTPDQDPMTPSPTVTVDTTYGAFDVWVVNPECKQIEGSLDDFPLYEWTP